MQYENFDEIDFNKLYIEQKEKSTFKVKAKMIDRGSVEELTGHAPGGVCPFGLNDNVTPVNIIS